MSLAEIKKAAMELPLEERQELVLAVIKHEDFRDVVNPETWRKLEEGWEAMKQGRYSTYWGPEGLKELAESISRRGRAKLAAAQAATV